MTIVLPIRNHKKSYTVKPQKIIALGLNYAEHIRESDNIHVSGLHNEIPREPILFNKTPNVLIGPGEAIVIPKFVREYQFESTRTDYEAELAIIIKDRCKNITNEEAYEHILGFTCMNDVSQRNLQSTDKSGWFRGKSLDTFGPIGPRLVYNGDINPQDLEIRCRLNGKQVQDSNTKHMIFKIPEILAFVSRNFTLEPGDIVMTGTPSGVGPIKHGDIVEVEIEGIGVLRNPVVEE